MPLLFLQCEKSRRYADDLNELQDANLQGLEREIVGIVKDNSDFIQKIVVSNTVPQSANEAFLPKHLHVLDISGNFLLFH